jgi:hypothetical protein
MGKATILAAGVEVNNLLVPGVRAVAPAGVRSACGFTDDSNNECSPQRPDIQRCDATRLAAGRGIMHGRLRGSRAGHVAVGLVGLPLDTARQQARHEPKEDGRHHLRVLAVEAAARRATVRADRWEVVEELTRQDERIAHRLVAGDQHLALEDIDVAVEFHIQCYPCTHERPAS